MAASTVRRAEEREQRSRARGRWRNPTAMPTSASARTGPSLRPSPTIATASCRCRKRLERSALLFRRQARSNVLDANRGADPTRRMRMVAGQERHIAARGRAVPRSSTRASESGVSSSDSTAWTRPAPADIDHRMAARLQRPRPFLERRREAASPGLAIKAPFPAATGSPSTLPRMPRPGTARTSRVATGSIPRAAAASTIAARQPVLGMALQPGCPCEHLVALRPVALDADEARLCPTSACRSCRRR